MKKRLPILILLALVGGGYWYWQEQQNRQPEGRILVSGNLELTQVDMAFKTPGRIIELNVREGDWVETGDVIAKLDDEQLRHTRAGNMAAVAEARSQYQQLQTAIEFQKAQIDTEVALHQAEKAATQATLDELLSGSRRQEIQQAEAAVADAQARYDNAQQDWARAETLYGNQDISAAQYDQYRSRAESAEAQLQQAKEHYDLVLEGPRKETIAAQRAQVARADAAIAATEANRIEVRRKEQQLQAIRAQIERAEAQVGVTQALINDATLLAPMNGIIQVKAAELGEVVAAGTTVVNLGDLQHPWLRAYINETDLGKIKVGGHAELRTDSFPDKIYEGRISFISPEAEFTPKQIQTEEERVKLVYRIKIDVDNTDLELKNNMPVDAELILD